VFGNHDTPAFQDRVRREIRGIRWLENDAADVETHGVTLRILGASEPEDLLHAVLSADASTVPAFTLALAHFPPQIYPAAQLGIPLVLAGHTHGGQIRLGPSHAPHTSCDLDKNLASGVIRLGETLCAISRGVGETMLDLRVNCPPQLSLYTLRRGELPGGPDREADAGTMPRVRQVIAW
jgi:predicted MPP superfamily phosphohydrolase